LGPERPVPAKKWDWTIRTTQEKEKQKLKGTPQPTVHEREFGLR